MRTLKGISASALAVLFAASAYAQPGTGFTISDGDVFFTQGTSPTVGTGTGATGANFRVNGAAGTDHLFQTWWWYRVEGQTRETAFFNASGTTAGGNAATTNFTVAEFNASLNYLVTDTGTNTGEVRQSMVITNTSPAALRLNLFNYADFDVNATSGTDSAVLAGPNLIRITDTAIAEFEGVNASAYQVTAFSTIRGSLANTTVTNLDNSGLPFNGDFTGAFQWVLDIPVGGSATVVGRMAIVPEPASLSLLGLAGLALFRRR